MATSASSGTEFVSLPLLAVKDEPQDDPEMADSNFVDNQTIIVAEPDPMNLLDTMVEAQISDEHDSEASSDQLHSDAGGPSDELWQSWLAQFPWLLHEEEDGIFGYCLYCNSNVSFKYLKSPIYHAKLRTHREKEENYLAFKQSEEHANLSSSLNGVTIKQEFGTDSNSSAIRFKRISQTEPLFNFMWRRWQKRHPWLERDKDEPTHGKCKYCKHRLYVEYSYIRTRHELGIKHRIAEKQWKLKNAKGASNDKNASEEEEPDDQNTAEKQSEMEEQQSEQESTKAGESTEQSNRESDNQQERNEAPLKRKRRSQHNSPWLELQANMPLSGRCKLCNVGMQSHNFARHLRSRVHIEAEKALKLQSNNSAPKVKQEFSTKLRNWKMFAKKHPWLIGDPDDSNFAYCKYCKIRLLQASYPVKRLLHERGARHRNAVRICQNKMRKAQVKTNNEESESEHEEEVDEEESDAEENNEEESEDSQEETEENEDDEQDQDDEDDQENTEAENDDKDEEDQDEEDNEEKKPNGRLLTSSDDWFKMFPWCKRVKGEPGFMLCTYCNLKMKLSVRRRQHELTRRHKESAKAKTKVPTEKLTSLQRSQTDKKCPYFPWLVFTRNPEYVFCKYCSIRLTSGTSRTQHELTKRHKESARQFQQNDKKKKSLQNTSNNLAPVNKQKSTKKASKPLVFRSMKTKISMWRAKFPWLTYKRGELQPNYGFCKYCELRLFMPSDKFASKHQRSIKHRLKLQIIRKKELEEQQVEEQQEEEQQEEEPRKGQDNSAEKISEKKGDWDWEALNKEYPWLLPDKKNEPFYGYCNYCKKRLKVSRHFRDRHQETIIHKKAEADLLQAAETTADNPDKSKENVDVDIDNSVVELEDDDMNDDASVKSEPMTEDDVLDFLLQRSQQSKTQNYCRDADLNDSTEPACKRRNTLTQNESVKDRARRITTAHLEILRLTRDLNERKSSKKSKRMSLPSSILRTSTAIAALMSPPQAPAPTVPPSTRNNFELFFDSVCESIKTLPADLAAEGKIKVAQLVADLETRALNRSQSKEFVDNTNNIQIVTTPLSSSSTTSPALSAVDMPSTTTNGLEKDQSLASTSLEAGQTQMVSSYSLDSNLRIIPLGSTPNYRQSDSTTDNSIRRLQMSSTPQATQNSIKRVQVNSGTQQPNVGKIQVVQSFANSTPVRGTLLNQKTTQNTQGSSPSPLASYQHVQQIIASTPDSQRSVTQKPIQTQGSTTIIDNGFRRIHLGARPQPTPDITDMSFRRIQLPFKGTTITKTTKATAPSTYYINHSKNV